MASWPSFIRAVYSFRLICPSLYVDLKRTSSKIFSRLSVSSYNPSFNTAPKESQNVAYSSGDFSAFLPSSVKIRLIKAFRILPRAGLSCNISRLILSGKSSESTTPFTKRKYAGNRPSQLSVMKIFLTYNLTLDLRSGLNKSNGGLDGIYNKLVYAITPSTRL